MTRARLRALRTLASDSRSGAKELRFALFELIGAYDELETRATIIAKDRDLLRAIQRKRASAAIQNERASQTE